MMRQVGAVIALRVSRRLPEHRGRKNTPRNLDPRSNKQTSDPGLSESNHIFDFTTAVPTGRPLWATVLVKTCHNATDGRSGRE
jgi:hypothetical protein